MSAVYSQELDWLFKQVSLLKIEIYILGLVIYADENWQSVKAGSFGSTTRLQEQPKLCLSATAAMGMK